MSENGNTRKIVITAVMAAVSVVLALTPLGFIPWISGASLTIMQVPVIIGAVLEGPIVGMVIGLLFGLFSLIRSALAPTGPIDVFFVNPFISVLPRIFIGLTAWLIFKAFKGKLPPLASALAGITGSLTNTVLVLGALGIAGALPWELILSILVMNGLAEAAACAIIVTAVVGAWKKVGQSKKKADLEDIKTEEESGS